MDSRIFLYLNFLKKLLRSHLRLILTLSGMVLSVIILLTGFSFSETYFSSSYAAINSFKQSKVSFISGVYNYELYRSILDMEDYTATLELVSPYTYPVLKGKYNGQEIQVCVKDIRTNHMDCNMLLVGEDLMNRYSGELLYGRLLTDVDIEQKSNVVVINETLAHLLIGTANAVGEKISIPVYQINYQTGTMGVSYYEELLVVGVVSAYTGYNEEIAKNTSSDDTTAAVVSYIYTPLSLEIAEKEVESYGMTILCYNDDEQSYYNSLSVLSTAVDELDNNSNYSIQNYYTLGAQVSSVVGTTRSSLTTILIFLFLASGLLIINTMFFSVKERINEIGIRKAIGAFDSDIVKQFVFEGFVYGAISAGIGIVFGLWIGSLIYIILDLREIWNVALKVSADTIALCVIIPIIIGTVSSVLPALYASKIRITDAIKSE